MLYQDYKPDVLEKLQKKECEILRDFDAFCRQHQIDYFACGGTLLGAVRHGGFIPWDDDLDVGMTREHYEKFLRVAKESPHPDYQLLNTETDARFACMITKWYRKGTLFLDEDAVTCGYISGIAVDIFCFDNVADEKSDLRRQAMAAWSFGKLQVLSRIGSPTMYVKGFKAQAALQAARAAHWLLKRAAGLGLTTTFFYRRGQAACRRYERQDTERVAFLFDPTPYTSMLRRSDIYPTRELTFAGLKIQGPNRPEVYLRTRYGRSYMELPPEDRRHNHPPLKLDLGAEQ